MPTRRWIVAVLVVSVVLCVSRSEGVSTEKFRNKNGKATYYWNDQTSAPLFQAIKNVLLPPFYNDVQNRVVSMINRDILSVRFLGTFQLIHCESNLQDVMKNAGLLAQGEKYRVVFDWVDLQSISPSCLDPTQANLFGPYSKYAANLKTVILYNGANPNMTATVKTWIDQAKVPLTNVYTLSATPGSSIEPLPSGQGV